VMHLRVLVGLVLALACAGGASLGGLWKQKGAVQTRDVDIRHPLQSAVALFRSKWFVIGWIAAAIAWLLHIGALALAPLSLGQAVISGGIVLLGLLAERFFDLDVTRRQWVGLGLLGLGMAVLGVTAHGDRNHSSYGALALTGFELGAVGLGLGFAAGCSLERLRNHHGFLLGIVGGIFFGVSDVSIKALTAGSHGALGVFGPWTFIGILTAIGAFFATARSLQIGNAVAVIAATTSAANVLGIIGGIVVFGDPIGSSPATTTGRMLAFALVVFAVALVPAPVRAHKALRRESSRPRTEGDSRVSISGAPAIAGSSLQPVRMQSRAFDRSREVVQEAEGHDGVVRPTREFHAGAGGSGGPPDPAASARGCSPGVSLTHVISSTTSLSEGFQISRWSPR
jgi:drug/metabolite transporter (DMT)-like permease